MFRSLSLSAVLVALVACEEEPMGAAAFDTGWEEAARAEDALPSDTGSFDADLDLDAAAPPPISVPCGKELRGGYTNATDASRCVNVRLLKECKEGAGGSARVPSGNPFGLTEGASVDVSVPAGEQLWLYCGGVQGASGCCEFVVDRALGACAEG